MIISAVEDQRSGDSALRDAAASAAPHLASPLLSGVCEGSGRGEERGGDSEAKGTRKEEGEEFPSVLERFNTMLRL